MLYLQKNIPLHKIVTRKRHQKGNHKHIGEQSLSIAKNGDKSISLLKYRLGPTDGMECQGIEGGIAPF